MSTVTGDAGNTESQSRSLSDMMQQQESISMKLAELFYPSYKRFIEGSDISDNVEDNLSQANINTTVEIYLSRALGQSVVAGGAVFLFVMLFTGVVGYLTAGFPDVLPQYFPYSETGAVQTIAAVLDALTYVFFPMLFGIVAGIFVAGSVFGLSVYYPRMRKKQRSREIDLLLGDGIAFMYSLSVGGTNQIQVMEAIAAAEDTYGEVSVEFQRIVYEMKYFNTDYETAVENVSQVTPNKEFEGFLSDMLSVINSGGNMASFLETQHDMMRERSKKKQEEMLDTMEFFGEMYMSLNILPMGLLIVLVIVSMMGSDQMAGLYITVYVIIPALNIMFGILLATVKQDEPGDGRLDPEGKTAAIGEDETDLRDMGVIDYYQEKTERDMFGRIRRRELQHRVKTVLRSPWEYFRLRPLYVLAVTVPLTIVMMLSLVLAGLAQTSVTAFLSDPYTQTVMWLYVPVLLNALPVAFFYEWNYRTRGQITDTLTQDIRKLANANETGQPVLEAIRMSAGGQDTLLATEFRALYKKAKFGTALAPALVEFNNRYRIPRLARVVKLIQKAQESSSNITEVLEKAAVTSQYQDDLERDRKQRTRMQVAVTAITFLVFLGVILMLEVYFLGEMIGGADLDVDVEGGGQAGGADLGVDIDIGVISMLFFHAVTLQAIFAGAISGYVQTGRIRSGLKYMCAYMIVTVIAWGALAL